MIKESEAWRRIARSIDAQQFPLVGLCASIETLEWVVLDDALISRGTADDMRDRLQEVFAPDATRSFYWGVPWWTDEKAIELQGEPTDNGARVIGASLLACMAEDEGN